MVQASLTRPSAVTPLFWLVSFHVAGLVVGHVLGSKSTELGPFIVTLTVLTFPITFLTTDLVNEHYGPGWARRMSAAGLASVAFAYALIEIARVVPTASGSHLPAGAFDHVMSASFVHPVALVAGYFSGQLADIMVFHRIRRISKGRFLWARVLVSTAAGETVDGSLVTAFVLLAPAVMLGESTPSDALDLTWDQATLRFGIVLSLLPILYFAHAAHRIGGRRAMTGRSQDARKREVESP